MDDKKIFELYDEFVMPVYSRTPLRLVRGKGSYVWDGNGEKYLDFFPGWGVSGIGHCHPRVVKAIKKQAGELIHVSNNYYHDLQALLAKKIIDETFPGKVFFCNSGAEANEAAIKLARKFGNPSRNEIITFEGAFHGRTIATVTATGQKKYVEGFEPLPAGFVKIPFNDIGAFQNAVSDKTVAVILEPVQGEGGINVAEQKFLVEVRRICSEKNILLIFDEVQSGMGRAGKLFAYQNYRIEPDVLTISKSLGGGFPIAAIVAKKEIADTLGPGKHGTTFGGSPLACAAALATFEAIEKDNLLKNAVEMGKYLREKLNELKKKFPVIKEVRGVSLMLGLELNIAGKTIYEECLKKKLLINCTQENVLRIMPPITVSKKEIDSAVRILDEVFAQK
ncbi:MAG TPA: aspartate aminotransferase family protein [Candidatus Paceibacterota bacterium]